MIKQFYPIFLTLVFLSGCETIGPTKSDLNSLAEGKTGVVILDYEEFEGLYGYHVYLANQETNETVRLLGSNNPGGWVKGGLAVNTVNPGIYQFVEGGLADANRTANMPLLAYWFEPFEINAGELVDLGKLVMEKIEVSSIQKHEESLIGKLLGMKDFEGSSTFVVYRFEDIDESRSARLLAKMPEISELNRVRRTPKARLTRREFESVVLQAYKPDSNGQPPKEEHAKSLLAESIAKLTESESR